MSAITEDEDNEVPSTGAALPASAKFEKLKRWVIDGHRERNFFRKEATRAYEFVANQQWSETDLIQLDKQHRPAVSFNRTAPIIKAVCGLEVNGRQTVAYLPRKQGDVGIDEARTAAVKWARDLCNAEDEESEAFRDLAICGEGWTESRMSYDDKPKGEIVEERIDPLEMGVNKGACKINYHDARMVYRIRIMDSEDALALFNIPDLSAAALHASWLEDDIVPADGGEGNKKDYPSQTRAGLERDTGRRTTVKLVQVQYWEREDCYLIAQDGVPELQELDGPGFEKFQQRAEQMRRADMDAAQAHAEQTAAYATWMEEQQTGALGDAAPFVEPPPMPGEPPEPTAPKFTYAKVKKKCYYQAFLGEGLIEDKPLKLGEFQFKAMTGDRDRKNKCFYGMLRDMFDPQMWANKWLSQTMHIMNTNAKGGIMAETDAFINVRKAETDWADNTKIIWTKPGALSNNKIKERTAPPLPQGLGELMQFALSSLRDVTGVNLELLGQADREQAAILEADRRRAAMTILATLFDSRRRYHKDQGRLLLKLVELLPEGTLIRVFEQGQYKFIPLIKEGTVEEFDVVVDETPSSPDQKQAIWATTSQLLQQGIVLPPPVLVKLLKYSPYPESVVKEITDAFGLGSELPPEMLKQKLEQAEQALQVMENALKEAQKTADTEEDKVAIDMLNTDIEAFRAITERMTAKMDSVVAMMTAAQPKPSSGGEGTSSQTAPEVPEGPSLTEIHGMLAKILQTMNPAQTEQPQMEGQL